MRDWKMRDRKYRHHVTGGVWDWKIREREKYGTPRVA